MPELSRVDFYVLDALADGSEPFSMIYQDVVSREPSARDVRIIAISLTRLMSAGLIGVEPPADTCKPNADTLIEHYHGVDKELEEVGRPFYYSKGEYFFQMTTLGRTEWEREEYQPFYGS